MDKYERMEKEVFAMSENEVVMDEHRGGMDRAGQAALTDPAEVESCLSCTRGSGNDGHVRCKGCSSETMIRRKLTMPKKKLYCKSDPTKECFATLGQWEQCHGDYIDVVRHEGDMPFYRVPVCIHDDFTRYTQQEALFYPDWLQMARASGRPKLVREICRQCITSYNPGAEDAFYKNWDDWWRVDCPRLNDDLEDRALWGRVKDSPLPRLFYRDGTLVTTNVLIRVEWSTDIGPFNAPITEKLLITSDVPPRCPFALEQVMVTGLASGGKSE